jgi:MinD superfamily P-loop ATPase
VSYILYRQIINDSVMCKANLMLTPLTNWCKNYEMDLILIIPLQVGISRKYSNAQIRPAVIKNDDFSPMK